MDLDCNFYVYGRSLLNTICENYYETLYIFTFEEVKIVRSEQK